MNKILIIPDSFKGTMSSREVGRILEEEAHACWPEAEVTRVEVADGGEGTVDAFLAVLPGEKRRCRVHGPFGEWVDAAYGRMGETAVIEMAAAAGLPLAAGRPPAAARPRQPSRSRRFHPSGHRRRPPIRQRGRARGSAAFPPAAPPETHRRCLRRRPPPPPGLPPLRASRRGPPPPESGRPPGWTLCP